MASQYKVTRLLIAGLVFHLIYIGTIFDCYFTSPVIHGMKNYRLESAESKRLVLIVGDGLRADLLLSTDAFPSISDAPKVVAPYLRSIVETRGAFGVSHTRVPTESRPGHVALIGGMYEDVSAVTKGWKTNPVDFDSIFNQSSHTFAFGSPDILPMFARGATPGKVKTWCYDGEDEDFTKDATALDIWVLDHLRILLHNASTDAVLDSQLRSEKVVFFLHLLGLDTTGHSYRPRSKEYMNNILVVDTIVRQTESLLSDFYKDEETSFIFSADHGMSEIGNHGDGDPDNTRTPLIAWGRGIRGPLPDSFPSSHDSYSQPWHLSHLLRRDVEQADVAPLIAALLGIHWPTNSVGVLPDLDPTRPGYLLPRGGDETKAKSALVNAKVILEQYRIKHELKEAHTLFYKPFAELEGHPSLQEPLRLTEIANVEQLISDGQWYNARLESAKLVQSGLAGLRYLQTYNRFLIGSLVAAAYIGWAAYASLFIFKPHDVHASRGVFAVTIVAMLFVLASWTLFAIQRSPPTFYLYVIFPCYFWQQFILKAARPLRVWVQAKGRDRTYYIRLLVRAGLVMAALQSMVAAYTHRSLWSGGFVLMGIAWPLFSLPKKMLLDHCLLFLSWALACLITAVFPLLGVDKKESLCAILTGGAGILAVGSVAAVPLSRNIKEAGNNSRRDIQVSFAIQLSLILAAMTVTTRSTLSLQAKQGLPLQNQVLGWIVLVAASLFPFLSRVRHDQPMSRILMFFLSFGACFVILSISVEGLFYLAYSITLVIWIDVEAVVREDHRDRGAKNAGNAYSFRADDLRIALFFLFFVQIAFFGTGNVASISSFYLEPVYRLVPVFNPFLMAALLVFKIVAPYVILSVTFATLNARLHLPPFSLFLVALTLTDGMTMAFFVNVTDTGSWLEIGQSISFFCITSLLLVWSAGICAAGEYLMADSLKMLDSGRLKGA